MLIPGRKGKLRNPDHRQKVIFFFPMKFHDLCFNWKTLECRGSKPTEIQILSIPKTLLYIYQNISCSLSVFLYNRTTEALSYFHLGCLQDPISHMKICAPFLSTWKKNLSQSCSLLKCFPDTTQPQSTRFQTITAIVNFNSFPFKARLVGKDCFLA